MNKKYIFVIGVALLLVAVAFSGCLGNDDDDDDEEENDEELAEFEVTNFNVDEDGLEVTITADIENVGDGEGDISLYADGEEISSWSLGPGDTEPVDEKHTFDEDGTYDIELGDQSETVTVEEEDDDNGYVGSGEETFSGTWEGKDALGQEEYDGTWEFTIDWEDEDVSGWFEGDAAGDIDGSVSEGEITASGDAALGYVTWEGTFSPDGSSISGYWEAEQEGITAYSGTWSGEEGELDNGNGDNDNDNDEENGLPDDDQVDGEEPLDRYPDSVMLDHAKYTGPDAEVTDIEYGTEDVLDDVVSWYKEELGDPIQEEVEPDETTLYYQFEEGQETAEITISENEYTTIDIIYGIQE